MALTLLAALAIFIMLAFYRASITSWVLAMMVVVPVVAIMGRFSDEVLMGAGAALILFIVFFGIPYMRRNVVSGTVFKLFRKVLPQISLTEQEAIDAGTVWWDGELFSGNPDWDKLMDFPKCGVSEREQAFLDNEVEHLCAMLDDWDITHNRADLPPDVWQYIKDKGFFGRFMEGWSFQRRRIRQW